MRLHQPTDFLILDALAEGGRNVATNIALEIDKNRPYVNTRLPVLADYRLLRKIGPAENSGLYEITERGRVVLELQDEYEKEAEFEELMEETLG